MASEQGWPTPPQQMQRTIAILEHEKAILKQELNAMVEELAKYRSSLRGYEGAHTRIEQLEQQLREAHALLKQVVLNGASDYDTAGRATVDAAEAFFQKYPLSEETNDGK